MHQIDLVLNGKGLSLEVEDHLTLLELLRDRLHIKSTKEGCGIGECGACTVLLNDKPVYSCLTLAIKADKGDVKTVEFLSKDGRLHELQEAFIRAGAVQCGYCTPGMLLSAYSLLNSGLSLDEEVIKEGISGNLCRCTGYVQIVEAIRDVAGL